MADTINVQDVKKELGEYVKNNKSVLSAGVYSPDIQLNSLCKDITAVKGKFPQFHKILSHVIQGFKAEWQELGKMELKNKMLENFHHKVNLPVIPSEILHSWLAELYTTGKTAKEHPISKMIIADLNEKIVDDLQILSIVGERNDSRADGEFGYSLDGIATQVYKAVENTTHPAFRIPLNALTDDNIIDEIKSFEKQIPSKMRRKVKDIVMSTNNVLRFADLYEMEYGTKVTYTEGDKIKTPLTKKNIVGLDNLPDDIIFATLDGNLVRLIDVFSAPSITDVQVQDYMLKLFSEFWLGYDFLINEIVYVGVFDGSSRGLNNETLNDLYYPEENLNAESDSSS